MKTTIIIGSNNVVDTDIALETFQAIQEEEDIFEDEIGLAMDSNEEIQAIITDIYNWYNEEEDLPEEEGQVLLYRDIDFAGTASGLDLDYEIDDFTTLVWPTDDTEEEEEEFNDTISSIQVAAGLIFIGWSDVDYEGDKLIILSDSQVSDLREIGWNDRLSSCQVISADDLELLL